MSPIYLLSIIELEVYVNPLLDKTSGTNFKLDFVTKKGHRDILIVLTLCPR